MCVNSESPLLCEKIKPKNTHSNITTLQSHDIRMVAPWCIAKDPVGVTTFVTNVVSLSLCIDCSEWSAIFTLYMIIRICHHIQWFKIWSVLLRAYDASQYKIHDVLETIPRFVSLTIGVPFISNRRIFVAAIPEQHVLVPKFRWEIPTPSSALPIRRALQCGSTVHGDCHSRYVRARITREQQQRCC